MDGYGLPVLVPSQDLLGGVCVYGTCWKSLLLLSKCGQEDRLKIWLLVRKTNKQEQQKNSNPKEKNVWETAEKGDGTHHGV